MKNCLNCAAPYDTTLIRCPYCGTAYYDMSAINMDTREPFYLKIRVNDLTVTQLVRPIVTSIEIQHDDTIASSRLGEPVRTRIRSEIATNIEFHSIPGNDGTLMTVTKETE